MRPIKSFDVEAMRARALADLRRHIGREPTAEDIAAERERERLEHPLRTIAVFPAVKVSL